MPYSIFKHFDHTMAVLTRYIYNGGKNTKGMLRIRRVTHEATRRKNSEYRYLTMCETEEELDYYMECKINFHTEEIEKNASKKIKRIR